MSGNNPIAGSLYLLRGLSYLPKPGIRAFVLIPLLINLFLFGGAIASLLIYGNRTSDWSAILRFWQPMIQFSALEFKVNRAGLALMILAVVIRIYLNFFAS